MNGSVKLVAVLALLVPIAPAGAEAASGDLLISDRTAFGGDGGVIRVHPVTGTRTTLSENAAPAGEPAFKDPYGIVVEADRQPVVAGVFDLGPNLLTGAIDITDPGGARDGVSLTGAADFPVGPNEFGLAQGVAVEAGGDLVVADPVLDALVRVDRTSGQRSILSNNSSAKSAGTPSYSDPRDVDVLENGDIVVVEPDVQCAVDSQDGTRRCGALIRVDPTTGSRSLLANNKTVPQVADNRQLHYPLGIDVEPSGDVLVANKEGASVLRVDQASGEKTLVSNNSFAGTGGYEGPLDLVSDGDFIYVTDAAGVGQVLKVQSNGTKNLLSSNTVPPGVGAPQLSSPGYIDRVPVGLRSASVSPITFRPEVIGRFGKPVGQTAARRRRGARFRYRLDGPARVRFSLWRSTRGRIVAGRCRRQTRANRGRRACVRWRRSGAFSHRGSAGRNAVRFSGRRRRGVLPAGRYRALLVARNSRGLRSVPVGVRFRIKRP